MASALLFILFFQSIMSLSIANISIDCGSKGSYVDSNNVTWVGDEGFVTAGKSMNNSDVLTKPFNTLRYFPSGQTNCYTNIPVTKSKKTLVMTKFYYENYDGNFSPPSFDLVFDGIHRDSIEITESSLNDEETFYYSELIFAPVNESISICLLRTSPSNNPFISSIEVYSFDVGMYADLGPNEGLFTRQRSACGAKESISYPLDRYGRTWLPLGFDDARTDLTTSAPSIDITGASNKPPEVVMSKASSIESLQLFDLGLLSTGLPIYLALYFSEPQSLGRTQKRSFNVFLDNTQVGSGPITPVFGKATQVVLRDVVATSLSQIVFQSTDDSVLPPIINGFEMYSISNSVYKGGQRKKKSKLALILGITFASAYVTLLSAFVAIFLKRRQNAKPQSNTAPTTSTGFGAESGISPLVGRQLASDVNHPGHDEPGVYDIDEMIGVDDSYFVHQDDHHQDEAA